MGDHQANIGNVTETVFVVEQWNLTWRLILAVGHGTAHVHVDLMTVAKE